MAINMQSLRRSSVATPPRLLIYGPAGVGKTTLAAGAPDPVFLPLEDGFGVLDVVTFPLLRTFQDVEQAIGTLAADDHDRKTVVLDSMDWLERIIWAETCARNGWKSIEQPEYGKGYGEALDLWKYLLDGLAVLRDERGMGVILLAHSSIRRFESPETEPYDRFMPKLHESKKGIGANPLLQEAVDAIFFTNFRSSVVKDRGKNDKAGEGHARGVSGGTRMVYTRDRPAAVAKNRYSMPPEISLPDDPAQAWPTVAQHIPFYSNAQ